MHPISQLLAAIVVALVVPVAATAMPHASRPAQLNQSLDRTSDKGLFRIKVASSASPIPMNAIHRWTVQIADARGRPVSGASLTVDGGMPEHGHGLPTAPRAIAAGEPGHYVIQGMKFSMDGWWELKLAINAAGASDKVTFNIVL